MSLYKTLKDFRKREKEKKGRWFLNTLEASELKALFEYYKINGFGAVDGGEVRNLDKAKDTLYSTMAKNCKIMLLDEGS